MDSPIAYIGGKSKLSKSIISLIPEHKTYVEVFAGALWVFFRKEESKYEVVNDLDSDLVAFYRVLQNHLEEFFKQFRFLLSSREWYEDFTRQQDAGGLTDIQRAARYYYIQRHTYGGKVKGRSFGVNIERPPKINLLRMEEELSSVHLRMSRVVIENLPWHDIVKRYDRQDTFFYLDPPYYKAPHYRHNFLTLDDFAQMAKILSGLRGQFILSINDLPEIRDVFREFYIKPVALDYSVSKKERTPGRELLINNFTERFKRT